MKMQLLSAGEYHEKTGYFRNRISPHHLDFDAYPLAFKAYETLERIGLPTVFSQQDRPLLTLFSSGPGKGRLDIAAVSHILFLAYGVTSVTRSRSIPILNRTLPSAGGLYPCHLYVAISGIEGLETGVYYFDPVHFCLCRLHGTYAPRDVDTVCFMVTASFYTSAWKYRERAFRYMLLDAGHLVENLDLALGLYDVDHTLCYDFEDRAISDFLQLDPSQEVPLVCVSSGRDMNVSAMGLAGNPGKPADPSPEFSFSTDRKRPVQYEILSQIHSLGKIVKPDRPFPLPEITQKKGLGPVAVPMKPPPMEGGQGFVDSVLLRRSRRNFVQETLPVRTWSALMNTIFCSLCFDASRPAARALDFLSMGMICQNLENLDDGCYFFSRNPSKMQLMEKGRFARAFAGICLDQEWIKAAGINFLFMANLEDLEKAFGARGYRYVMFYAGRIAQRIYLAAQGLGLGCCGVGALYDGEAKALLGLNRTSVLLYAVAAGPIKKTRGHEI
ncbi:MAG: SagB family peptide dehydrogenase [Proteobacteria bacterium]|nr:SagB family peptide dehydrogenase [Pseudomonadota bacterium]